ncbi:kinase-like protein [Marasmius fiardii PR-910]|nr:kinase-like protein [Marasmius fiardii PR-910]
MDNVDGTGGPQSVSDEELEAELARIQSIFQDRERYRELLGRQGDDAQYWLDLLQLLADFPGTSTQVRSTIFTTMIRLCKASGHYPRCLILQNVRKIGEHPVGGGGFGDVWKGTIGDSETVRVVCLKVVKIYLTSDVEKSLKDYLREAIVWKQLKHPNLLPFLGIFYLDDSRQRLCLVSPWMDHGNLVQFLKATPREAVDHLSLVHDIASGLCYLHILKIIHGDLKGVNVLITPDRRACIGDFGLSRVTDTHALRIASSTSRVMGTARWLSPELLEGSRPTSKESDIYAFACVCYEIFTGLLPFHEFKNDAAVAIQVLAGKHPLRPESIPELQDGMWSIMESCWDPVPLTRPSVGSILTAVAELMPANTKYAPDWNDCLVGQVWNSIAHARPQRNDVHPLNHQQALDYRYPHTFQGMIPPNLNNPSVPLYSPPDLNIPPQFPTSYPALPPQPFSAFAGLTHQQSPHGFPEYGGQWSWWGMSNQTPTHPLLLYQPSSTTSDLPSSPTTRGRISAAQTLLPPALHSPVQPTFFFSSPPNGTPRIRKSVRFDIPHKHVAWVKNQKLKWEGLSEDTDSDDNESTCMTISSKLTSISKNSSNSSGSYASSTSSFLERYFPKRFFVLKSLSQTELEVSVETGLWSTQRHNECTLDQAYRTSSEVYLIFSANKSGEFYGYARMASSSIEEHRIKWGLRRGASERLHPSQTTTSPTTENEFVREHVEVRRLAPAELEAAYQRRATGPKSLPGRFSSPADLATVYESDHLEGMSTLDNAVQSADREAVVREELRAVDQVNDEKEQLGRPFKIDWICTERLPYFRTRHLRNPWNHDRIVKVSQDGTELEPSVGQQLIDEWQRFLTEARARNKEHSRRG